MVQMYKCDRCGRFYEENIISHENERRYLVTKNIKGDVMIREHDFDLCGDCQDELEKFLMYKSLKNTFTVDEVCKVLKYYENDPDTIFIGEKGHFTIADIKHLLSKEGEEHE